MPNVLGDSENYVMVSYANTTAIVPEWLSLPFYAILRSIPNNISVIAMFSAILYISMPLQIK